MNSVFKNAAVIRHFKRYGLLPRLLALLLTSCLSLPQIYLPRRSQADHVTVLSKTLQWLPRTKLRILNQHSECLRIWTLCHLPLFLALPWHSRLKWPQTAHDSQDTAFCFLCLLLWLSLSCTSQFPGPVAYSFSWGSSSSGEFSWTSESLHLYSPGSRTWSHTRYVGLLYCCVHLPLVQGRACLFDLS